VTRFKKGEIVQVVIDDSIRPLYGLVLSDAKKSCRVKVLERDPLWFNSVLHSREVVSVDRCSDECGESQLAIRWGVSTCGDCVRCPECGTLNAIRRLDSSACLSCVMKTCQPHELPIVREAKPKPKRKRGRPRKAA
jgi:hypothetical protein